MQFLYPDFTPGLSENKKQNDFYEYILLLNCSNILAN